MLGADVGVVQLARLGHRELEHLLGARRIRQLAQRDGRLALADGLLDPLVDLLQIDVQVGEHGRGDALALADQAEEDVLGADVVVLEADRLLARHRQDLPNPVGEVVVHWIPRRGSSDRALHSVSSSPAHVCRGRDRPASTSPSVGQHPADVGRAVRHRLPLPEAGPTRGLLEVRGLREDHDLVERVYTKPREEFQAHAQPHAAQQVHHFLERKRARVAQQARRPARSCPRSPPARPAAAPAAPAVSYWITWRTILSRCSTRSSSLFPSVVWFEIWKKLPTTSDPSPYSPRNVSPTWLIP